MVTELCDKSMPIGKDNQAIHALWNMTFGQVDQQEKEQHTEALLGYCELYMLAMVEI